MVRVNDSMLCGYKEEAELVRQRAYWRYLISIGRFVKFSEQCTDYFSPLDSVPVLFSWRSKALFTLFRKAPMLLNLYVLIGGKE